MVIRAIRLGLTSLWGGHNRQVPSPLSNHFFATLIRIEVTTSSANGKRFHFSLQISTNSKTRGAGHKQERSPAQFLILPSSIGNGSGKRKAESPKAVAPTTAGPGYHLAPGNVAESRRRQKPLPTISNHEQRGRNTTSAAACCRRGEPIQPGSRSFRGG